MSISMYKELLDTLGYAVTSSTACLVGERFLATSKESSQHLLIDVVDLEMLPHLEPLCRNIDCTIGLPPRPGVTTVKDVARINDELYLAQVYVPPGTKPSLKLENLASFWSYAAALIQGLRYLHGREWVHSALSPASILHSNESPLINDYWWTHTAEGVPFSSYASEEITMLIPPVVLPYLAPEQLAGEPPARDSDMYSLGAVLYHAVSGVAPRMHRKIELSSTPETKQKLLRVPILPLQELVPEVDTDIARFIDRLMAHQADDRLSIFDAESISQERSGNLLDDEDGDDDDNSLDRESTELEGEEETDEKSQSTSNEQPAGKDKEMEEPRLVRRNS